MEAIKVEVDWILPDYFSTECFICLQPTEVNEEFRCPLNFLLNYLKIEDQIEPFVCDECGKNLRRVENLRRELDYLLDTIQSAILNAPPPPTIVRECVAKKCKEKIICRKAEIVLERIDLKTETAPVLDPGFGCPSCQKRFTNSGDLKRHISASHKKRSLSRPVEDVIKPFKCTKCASLFKKKENLRRHFKMVHLQLRPFKCFCGESFASANNLLAHQSRPECKPKQKILNPKQFSCQICEKTFTQLTQLNKHVSVIHENKRYHCQAEGCDINYSSPTSLRAHYKQEHPDFIVPKKPRPSIPSKYPTDFTILNENGKKLAKCDLCSVTFKSVNSVRVHLADVHGPKEVICEICGYAAARQRQMDLHMERRHQDKTVNSAQCNFCPKQFASIRILNHHISKSHGEKRFKCQHCDFKAPFEHLIDAHLKRKHKKIGKKVEES